MEKMIVLVGMPGCGKTTIGRILARELNVPFIDTDRLIAEAEGMSLSQIQKEKGMQYFLEAEERALLSLDDSLKVVATGGSAIFSSDGMMYLSSIATMVYLDVDLGMLKLRMGDPKARGVVLAPNQTIAGVYRQRRPLYLRYADIRIRTHNTRPRNVALQILSKLNEPQGNDEQNGQKTEDKEQKGDNL
ncbi:MAG: shikimate kinase [Clostridiales bacterium]|nr:shikimate kinase [Candidatus Scatonaster coprocaballi]